MWKPGGSAPGRWDPAVWRGGLPGCDGSLGSQKRALAQLELRPLKSGPCLCG